MLAVEVPRGRQQNKKLRPVRVRPAVGHAQQTSSIVAHLTRFIRKLAARPTLAARAVSPRKVAALGHEVGNDAVERCGSVASLSLGEGGLGIAALARAEHPKVLGRFWDLVGEQLYDQFAELRAVLLELQKQRGPVPSASGAWTAYFFFSCAQSSCSRPAYFLSVASTVSNFPGLCFW